MRSTFALLSIASALVASAAAAPSANRKVVDIVEKRQYIDYGPFFTNCTTDPTGCPTNGPSGTLNSPSDGDVLTTYFDNSGFVDISYTPVKASVGDSGSVQTSSVIFTLRQYFYGVPAFSDSIIVLGQLTPPHDYSQMNVRLGLPARFYDGDSDPQNDVHLGSGGSGSVGEWAFQVVEQQRYTASAGATPTTIEFYSAAPLVNITYVAAS